MIKHITFNFEGKLQYNINNFCTKYKKVEIHYFTIHHVHILVIFTPPQCIYTYVSNSFEMHRGVLGEVSNFDNFHSVVYKFSGFVDYAYLLKDDVI